MRWGELTELRVKDLDFAHNLVTVRRAVVEVEAGFRVNDERFAVTTPALAERAAVRAQQSAEAGLPVRGHVRVADLTAMAESVGLARELLGTWVGRHRCLDDALLLASETVTNAIEHGSPADATGAIRLVVRWTRGRIYVAVTDAGTGNSTPQVAPLAPDSSPAEG